MLVGFFLSINCLLAIIAIGTMCNSNVKLNMALSIVCWALFIIALIIAVAAMSNAADIASTLRSLRY